MAQRFDWPALMRAGIAGRGLLPDQFWALTPAELALLLGIGGAAPAMTRGALDALMTRYPDGQSTEERNGRS